MHQTEEIVTTEKLPGFSARRSDLSRKVIFINLIVGTFLIYYFSNPKPKQHFDYTFRVAENLLYGRLGLPVKPRNWLNELVPHGDLYYSVFPLGSVLTMIPFAALKVNGLIKEMPSAFIAGATASLISLFLLLITQSYGCRLAKSILLVAGMMFGTWTWTNLTFGGAWQLALGFGVLGELGAIYFTVFRYKPLLAGAFFALAFGNRTEILIIAPILLLLLLRQNSKLEISIQNLKAGTLYSHYEIWKSVALFCAIPFMLGVLTLIYNYVRFGSPIDFGYARIPGVLTESCYNYGIFSARYIPRQAYDMLFKLWEIKPTFPYVLPNGFGASILLSSPFLLLLLRGGRRDKILKYAAWGAIIILTLPLWMHGNSGGWQFGYRYAMILLPWAFLILLENGNSGKIILLEWFLFAASFLLNAYVTYLFYWTNYIKP